MNRVLARLHTIDISAAGLGKFGKAEGFYVRQISTWSKQYEASKTEDTDSSHMDELIPWLSANVPPECVPAVVHGDFRLGNMIAKDGDIRAVLDWELCTLGDPLADVGEPLRQRGHLAIHRRSTQPLLARWEPPSVGRQEAHARFLCRIFTTCLGNKHQIVR